ncbi:MAG TPA: HEPN domain-containing protein [Candidatus Acetothermia bacterium]|nr:HEPN domain-containing protein [Candidatus Acetothermia bacterium]
MREETAGWWEQGRHDLAAARAMFKEGIYYAAAFLSHQAAEKALKALLIERRRELPPKTHNLLVLGRLAEAPEGVMSALRLLNPEYVASRYPDAANGIPAENYDAEKTERIIAAAEEVHKWVTSAFGRKS